jgi:hypothetical protein
MKLDLRVGGRELGVRARSSIKAKSYIPELFGALSSDVDHDHTGLSEIHSHDTLTGPNGVRLLAGPMRLVNHHCQPNCKVCFSRVFIDPISYTAADRT